MTEPKFKVGDHVRMEWKGTYHYGKITLIRYDGWYKVLFDVEGPDYWYYPEFRLELMTEEKTTDGA